MFSGRLQHLNEACISRLNNPSVTSLKIQASFSVALTTENEACILREVTDGLLRRGILI
jgi:hypothetical protein